MDQVSEAAARGRAMLAAVGSGNGKLDVGQAIADLMAVGATMTTSRRELGRIGEATAAACSARDQAAKEGYEETDVARAVAGVVEALGGVAARTHVEVCCCLFGALGVPALAGVDHRGELPYGPSGASVDGERVLDVVERSPGTLLTWHTDPGVSSAPSVETVAVARGHVVPADALAPIGRERAAELGAAVAAAGRLGGRVAAAALTMGFEDALARVGGGSTRPSRDAEAILAAFGLVPAEGPA